MKKSFFFVFAFLFVALACVTFSACGQTDTKTMEEDGTQSVASISDSEQIARANDYDYNYDNWYDFGKNNKANPYGHGEKSIAINTAEQLARFMFLCNDNWGLTDTDYKWRELNVYITADIDMSRMKWTPIGTKSKPYTGHFYGQNYCISGLKVYNEVNDAAGFFGFTEGTSSYVDDLAVIINVSISSNSGDCYAGGLIGQSKYTYVRRCAVRGSVYVGGKGTIRAGGIIGQALTTDGSKISDSVNYASVSVSVGSTIQGGLIGYAKECNIERCLNLGSVTKYGSNFAGIAGKIESGSITGCSEYGNVTKDGFSMIHGYNTSNVSVKNCAYGNTTSGGRSYWVNKTTDAEYNNLIGWTGSCQDSGDFTAWSKSVSSIQVPKSILFSFNISFGWDSPNGSGYFSATNNAMHAFYGGEQVYGTYGAKYQYQYVRGTLYNYTKLNICIKNWDMFSYDDCSVDNTESGMFYSEYGFLKFKNKVLMQGGYSDKKITYHSKFKTLTINAKNCNGYTNGGSYVYQRSYYYHDSISVNIYASHPLGYDVVCYETPTITSSEIAYNEGYTLTFSDGYRDSDYVKLTYFTGTTTINVNAEVKEYKYNLVFVDRIYGNSKTKKLEYNYESRRDLSEDIGLYATGGNYGFTFYVKVGEKITKNNSDISYDVNSGKVKMNLSNFALQDNLITVYANYGYVGEPGKHDVYLNNENAEGLFLPIYDIELEDKVNKQTISKDGNGGNIDSASELRTALDTWKLDVGYLVSWNELDDKKYKIYVKDNFSGSPYYREEVYSITFSVYSGFVFGNSDDLKFKNDDPQSGEEGYFDDFTIKYEDGKMIHNQINLNFTAKTYNITFDENTTGTIYTAEFPKSIDDNKAKFNHKVIVSVKDVQNRKFVGITCNGKIVTLEKSYTFVVDPQTYPRALEDNFKLSFAAVYVDETFASAAEPEHTGNYYKISSAANLQWLAEQVNAGNTFEGFTFTQTNDINFSGISYLPIGDENHVFKGIYDGGNYSILNIRHGNTYYNLDEDGYVGLFGNVQNATIKNLTIKNSYFTGNRYVGVFAGKATNSTFYNLNAYACYVDIQYSWYYSIYGGTPQNGKTIVYNDTVDKKISITQTIYTNDRVGFAGVVGNAVGCTFTGVGYNTGEIVVDLNDLYSYKGVFIGFVGEYGISGNETTTISQCFVDCELIDVYNFVGKCEGSCKINATDYYFTLYENAKKYVEEINYFEFKSYEDYDDYEIATGVNASNYASYYDYKKSVDNENNWMIINKKQVLKFFYWVL